MSVEINGEARVATAIAASKVEIDWRSNKARRARAVSPRMRPEKVKSPSSVIVLS